MKLSVVIPIYNVEEYIFDSLQSLFPAGIDESQYEVLLINDGTPDGSMAVAREFAAIHGNIRIIEKENEGVSRTRNRGIVEAKGDFITFVDSDDTLHPDSLSRVLAFIGEHPAVDVVVVNSQEKGATVNRYPWTGMFLEGQSYTGEEIFIQGWTRGSVCGCLFNREFLVKNDIVFPLMRNAEDTVFSCLWQLNARNVVFFNIPFYQISVRPSSASRDNDMSRLDEYVKGLSFFAHLCSSHQYNDVQRRMIDHCRFFLVENYTYMAVRWGVPHDIVAPRIKDFLPVRLLQRNMKDRSKQCFMSMGYYWYYHYIKLLNAILSLKLR